MLRFKDQEKDTKLPLRNYWKLSTFLRIVLELMMVYFLYRESGIYLAMFSFLVFFNMEGQFALNNYFLNANFLSAFLHSLSSNALNYRNPDETDFSKDVEDFEEGRFCGGVCGVCERCDTCSFWKVDKSIMASEVERSYCLGCGAEIMTESGQVCKTCEKKIY